MAWHNAGMDATPIKLPKKPRILIKEQAPDQRQFSVIPIRAATDRKLTGMEMRVLLLFCSYANRGGITWVGNARIAQHLGVGMHRVAFLTRCLIDKGYIKVLYKGYQGERAHTRQIIFNAALSLDEIVAVSGEKPPYMIEQEQKAIRNQPVNQQHKGATMQRKRKSKENSVTDLAVSNLMQQVTDDNKSHLSINEAQVLQLQRAVGPDLLALALDQCGSGATLEQVQTKLKDLLA
jgi:hypothetical protein